MDHVQYWRACDTSQNQFFYVVPPRVASCPFGAKSFSCQSLGKGMRAPNLRYSTFLYNLLDYPVRDAQRGHACVRPLWNREFQIAI